MSDVVRDPSVVAPSPAARLVVAAAGAAARQRASLAGAAAELRGPDPARLSDYARVTIRRLRDALVAEVEDALRARVAGALPTAAAARATLASARIAIARPALDAAGVLGDPALVARLVRRAEEHRLATLPRPDTLAPADRGILAGLARDDDPAVAEAATLLNETLPRRRDRFRDPIVPTADLPGEVVHRLVWSIAAALRSWALDMQGIAPGVADAAIVAAATAQLASHDEGAGIDARATALARGLDDAGRLDDAALVAFAGEGAVAVLVAGLGRRTRVALAPAWDMVLAPGGDRLALLLRAGGVARAPAGAILLRLAPDEPARVAAQLAGWDEIDLAQAREALRLWRLDEGYRDAIVALDTMAAGGAE